MRRRRRWVRPAVALAAIALLAGVDWAVGAWEAASLQRRRDLKARLDRLAFHELRTGIDGISFDPPAGYRIDLRVQNASPEPFWVMLPTLSGSVQIGSSWVEFPVGDPPGPRGSGSVVKLLGDWPLPKLATIETTDYTENLPGFMHVKLSLEAYVSPEENPEEEVGERREDFILFLRDMRRPPQPGQPPFIPLRAWTLLEGPKG